MLKKIISGGQTGADQGALQGARLAGIETGGTAPKGWRTETGPGLLKHYGLVESDAWEYPARTKANVKNSDGTLIFGVETSRGSVLTRHLCRQLSKPLSIVLWKASKIELATILHVVGWIKDYNICVLNIAGNRESRNPGIGEATSRFVVALVKELEKRP